MAVFYVWFPLRPDGGMSAAERMGLLTGIRKAGAEPDAEIVEPLVLGRKVKRRVKRYRLGRVGRRP